MSGQVIELIIFAAVAFFIVNKLISSLGTTSEDDPTKNKSFFGEAGSLKDVTDTTNVKKFNIIKPNFNRKNKLFLQGLIVQENETEILAGMAEVLTKIPTFNLANFLKGAKSAFAMILAAGENNNENELEELVDKRYLGHFKSIVASYGSYGDDESALKTHISEIYLFGNNIFIKVLFSGKDITDKIKDMHEEWTFTKSALNADPKWSLTNIDRPQ